MNIDELTLGQVKEINSLTSQTQKKHSLYTKLIGRNLLIRTVTMIYTGNLIEESEGELLLTDAAWIPETKRWMDTLKTCDFNEVEPYIEDLIINKLSILDVTIIDHLPREQK